MNIYCISIYWTTKHHGISLSNSPLGICETDPGIEVTVLARLIRLHLVFIFDTFSRCLHV